MNAFTKHLVLLIASIPEGKVITYGRLAELANHKGAARQVSWTLRTQTEKYQLPWHRVLGANGKITTPEQYGQKALLLDEGVEFMGDKTDLKIFGWQPDYGLLMHIENQVKKEN